MNPNRPPLAALGPATTCPFGARVSSATSFHTPAKRRFATRSARMSGAVTSAIMATPSEKARTRIQSPSTRRAHGLERHDVDPLERLLPVQHTFDLHLVPCQRRTL